MKMAIDKPDINPTNPSQKGHQRGERGMAVTSFYKRKRDIYETFGTSNGSQRDQRAHQTTGEFHYQSCHKRAKCTIA